MDSFIKEAKALSSALIDDFRGFLINGTDRVEVPKGRLHIQIAVDELTKSVPGWKYEGGVGQNPIVELMQYLKGIYITKIESPDDNNPPQRTVGYLTDAYSDIVNYKGTMQYAYDVIKNIALGMGYDVDEYNLIKDPTSKIKNPVKIENYKASLDIKKSPTIKVAPKRSLTNGDKIIFDSDNNIIGVISNGKYRKGSNYIELFAENNDKGDDEKE